MSICRSCHAPVQWAVANATGKRMILNPPSEDGNIIVGRNGGRDTAYVFRNADAAADYLADHPDPAATRHLDHHVTCPDAKTRWKR
jgi:hypothetical protein